jgi:hypothetical protein
MQKDVRNRTSPERRKTLRPIPGGSEPKAYHQLHDARIARTADGAEAVLVINCAVGVQIKIRHRGIREALVIDGRVITAELRVIEDVDGVGAQLQFRLGNS